MKNIHPELNGKDLNDLFSSVAPVEFVKFDPRKDSIAYVCFQHNYSQNNTEAVSRFDGRKAMGKILIVENATALADRIEIAPRRERHREDRREREVHPRVRAKQQKPKKARPAKKSVEDLDAELTAYMNGDIKIDEPLTTA